MELFNYQKLIFAENVICRVLEINLGISNYHYTILHNMHYILHF